MSNGSGYTSEDDARIALMVAQGVASKTIARALGRTPNGIESRVVTLRRDGYLPPAIKGRRRKRTIESPAAQRVLASALGASLAPGESLHVIAVGTGKRVELRRADGTADVIDIIDSTTTKG